MTSSPPPGPDPIWGGSLSPREPPSPPPGDGGSSSPDAPGPSDRLSRRLLQAAGVLSVLLIAVVANAVLHGDETGSDPLNPVAQAAEATESRPGGRFSLDVTYTSPSLPSQVDATGSGSYNSSTGRSEATLSVPTPQLGEVKIEAVADGSTSYMRSPIFAGKIPEDKEWIEVDPFLGEGEPDSLSAAGSGNAKSSLEMLAGSTQVERVGSEEIRGDETTRYRTTIYFDQIADQVKGEGKEALADEYEKLAEAMPQGSVAEVWIDAKEQVRRVDQTMTLPAESGSSGVTMNISEELYDFGAEPQIEIPDSSEVFDTTPLLRERLKPGEAS